MSELKTQQVPSTGKAGIWLHMLNVIKYVNTMEAYYLGLEDAVSAALPGVTPPTSPSPSPIIDFA